MFAAAQKAGIYTPAEVEVNHMNFGLVLKPLENNEEEKKEVENVGEEEAKATQDPAVSSEESKKQNAGKKGKEKKPQKLL